MSASDPASYSPEKTKLIQDNGWDKGLVLFGFLGSETTVKVNMAVHLVMALENDFAYKESDLVHVDVTFDNKPLITDKKGNKSMGVRSDEWMVLSGGKGYMPALMIEGTMYQESALIVKMFAEKYPDKSLSEEQQVEVLKWVDFNIEHQDKLLEAEKHFGTAALSPNEKNYVGLGLGQKDKEWEKEKVAYVDKVLKILDEYFGTKDNKAHYVGDKLTYADCAMINWPCTMHYMVGLKVKTRYPQLWAHYEALKAEQPAGAQDHYKAMPFVGFVISVLWLKARGIFSWGHHIENPIHWE